MIKRFYEHSFETSIIEPNGWSIDFGCGNDFYISKTFLDFGLKVIAVDPNPSIVNPLKHNDLFFEHKALTSNKNEKIISLNIYNVSNEKDQI